MMKSFKIMAVTMAAMMMAGAAMAGSVDIGLGRMDQAEFEALRQMVSGSYQSANSVTTDVRQDVRIAEFNQTDVDEIRQVMASGDVQRDATGLMADNGMVDIGTGAMATTEFCDLSKLVASNTVAKTTSGFAFICP
ncbi:MAG: hypothetical protein V2I40_00825 [Desulfobacteraceae bacterium]|jgi:hypothetical protein|nr:hypothetical protein [Desulfobacteraceae bacterium]